MNKWFCFAFVLISYILSCSKKNKLGTDLYGTLGRDSVLRHVTPQKHGDSMMECTCSNTRCRVRFYQIDFPTNILFGLEVRLVLS